MITGFNTDIDYNGVTYHVQTEDKGLDTPLILSLVYNRGTILASKRSPYNDLLLGQFDEKELAERLQRQHKLICAAIRAGRIEDLKKMNGKLSAAKKKETPPGQVLEPVAQIEINSHPKIEQKIEKIIQDDFSEKVSLKAFEPIKKPEIDLPGSVQKVELPPIAPEEVVFSAPIEITDADLIFEDTQKLDEVIMVPEDAVEIITGFSQTQEPAEPNLFIELLNEVTFRGGDNKTVSILVSRGKEKKSIGGISLMIKVIGSNFRPLIFHTKTDSNGVATVYLQIPQFSRGRAAILIKATVHYETAELRRVIFAG